MVIWPNVQHVTCNYTLPTRATQGDYLIGGGEGGVIPGTALFLF